MNLTLKRTPGIYLVGFMACGKTTIGTLLAERLGWKFVDMDQDIEARQGDSIAAIFEKSGEQEFRRIETETIRARVRDIERGEATVVAMGGGAFVQPVNLDLLSKRGISIWLDCSFETVQRRVLETAHRPLARDMVRFEQLYRSRLAAYGRADYRIAIHSDDPSAAVEVILALPLFA
ncbi:MAG: shikimate kinase [Acidobacteria bacterium]|nr:MAG: shikimate kinase [Acidobacteriota bacterium]